MNLCAAYKVFNAETYLKYSLASVYDTVDTIVLLLSAKPWSMAHEPPDKTKRIIQSFPDPAQKIRLIEINWGDYFQPGCQLENEILCMNFLLDYIRSFLPEVTHYFYIDADEIYHPEHVKCIRARLEALEEPAEIRGLWRCYWKSFNYWIDPIELSRPLIAFPITPEVYFTTQRETNLTDRAVIIDEHHICHLSYVLSNKEILKRKCSGTHGSEFLSDWYKQVWKAWRAQRGMRNLHPVYPDHFHQAVPSDPAALPPALRDHPFFGKDIIT